MKVPFKHVLLASAFLMAGAAHAATESVTLSTGGSVVSLGTEFSGLSGTGSLAFSSLLMGALNIAHIDVTAYAPAELIEINDEGDLAAKAVVTGLTGTNDSAGTFSVNTVSTAGGATMTALPTYLNSKGKTVTNTATTGGELTVTNIKVDLDSKAIYADLIGANGVGTQAGVHVWTYGTLEGATTFSTVPGTTVSANKLSTLTITDSAFNTFAQALGLTDFGKKSMAGIADYGVIDSQISVTTTAAVPEPSTYAMLVAGLAAIGFAAKRRRA